MRTHSKCSLAGALAVLLLLTCGSVLVEANGHKKTWCVHGYIKYGCYRRTGVCWRFCGPTYNDEPRCLVGKKGKDESGKKVCTVTPCKKDTDCEVAACHGYCCSKECFYGKPQLFDEAVMKLEQSDARVIEN